MPENPFPPWHIYSRMPPEELTKRIKRFNELVKDLPPRGPYGSPQNIRRAMLVMKAYDKAMLEPLEESPEGG